MRCITRKRSPNWGPRVLGRSNPATGNMARSAMKRVIQSSHSGFVDMNPGMGHRVIRQAHCFTKHLWRSPYLSTPDMQDKVGLLSKILQSEQARV